MRSVKDPAKAGQPCTLTSNLLVRNAKLLILRISMTGVFRNSKIAISLDIGY